MHLQFPEGEKNGEARFAGCQGAKQCKQKWPNGGKILRKRILAVIVFRVIEDLWTFVT